MRFSRKAGAPSDKSPKRLLVEPAELARKLAKEMDDHVVSRGEETWARNRYTVFLCPKDFENLSPRASKITAELAAKLARHAAEEAYLVQGDLSVNLVRDDQLEIGYFGIMAEKSSAVRVSREPEPLYQPAGLSPDAAGGPAGLGYTEPPAPVAPLAAPPADAAAARFDAALAASSQPVPSAQAPLAPARAQAPPVEQAAQMGLEGRVILITAGDEVSEFRQGRVIIGRSKEADLRVNDANVSRKHAAVYWNNGRIMIDDLGSTNGTMVNGYPVTRTMLRPTDVVAIGDSRLTVEGK